MQRMYIKIMDVCCDSHTEHINTLLVVFLQSQVNACTNRQAIKV
jgi:hypothetical protein